jgi:hypothetical protein
MLASGGDEEPPHPANKKIEQRTIRRAFTTGAALPAT